MKGIPRDRAWVVIGALAAVVLLNAGTLGSDPWDFRPGQVRAAGPLAFLVRLAHERWDLGLIRSVAMLAGLCVAALAAANVLVRSWRPWVLVAAGLAVSAALLLPAVGLQLGLRDSTRPWFFVNDSTYQIELAGQRVRDGSSPYGHDYGSSGLERFYSLDGTVRPGTRERQVALRHFAYFPGPALLAAAWGVLPSPWDDYRLFVALTTLGLLGAALVFPGPLWARVALGVAAAANPLVVRAAWFGTADAPTLLLVLLAFGLALRRQAAWAGLALGAAVLTKQFALAAAPFVLATLVLQAGGRRAARGLLAACALVVAGFAPFVAADAGAVWEDTVRFGSGTYRIVGYGLSALLVRGHVIADRNGAYPFFALAVAVWVPVTAVLVLAQLRHADLLLGAVGFGVSIFVLLFLGRVFQISYLAYPLTGLVLCGLVAAGGRHPRPG